MKTNNHFNRFAAFAAAIIAALVFAGCPVITDSGSSFVAVTGITGVPTGGKIGQELDLTGASVEPFNATNQTIVWSVKNAGGTGVTAIAEGKATPTAAGRLVVSAVIADGKARGQNYTQDFSIDISSNFVAVVGISGVPETGNAGSELDLNAAEVEPSDASYWTIVWTVTDAGGTGVTTADLEDGKATPAATGTLKLTAAITNGKAEGEDYTRDFEIIINAAGFIAVTDITGVPASVVKGNVLDLTGAVVTPQNAGNKAIVWTVTDAGTTGVTAITGGKATPAAAGTLVLSAAIANGKGPGQVFTKSFTVSVTDTFVAVTDIGGVPTGGVAGEELSLTTATVTPNSATYQTIVWSVKSAGTTGVTAITGGKTTPAAAGTLEVTATIANGTAAGAYTKDFSISIAAAFVAVSGISYTQPSPLNINEELDLTGAVVTPADATNKTIVWSVIDAGGTGVTTGDLADGKATPTGEGTLKLLATVVNGKAQGQNYTKTFDITVTDPTPPPPSYTQVTNITGIPSVGKVGVELDLTGVTIVPADRTGTAGIVWTVTDAGGTGVSTGDLADGKATPTGEGTLKLTATIADGLAAETPYVKANISIYVTNNTVFLYKLDGTETLVNAYEKLDDALAYINTNGVGDPNPSLAEKYVIELKADQTLAAGYTSPTSTDKANLEITLRGNGGERTITGTGSFSLGNTMTLILDNNITLNGISISVGNAHIRMKTGSKVTGISSDSGTNVIAMTTSGKTGSFTLEGGEISSNGRVYALRIGADNSNYTFTMSNGLIKNNGNNTSQSSALRLDANATVTMSGGEISGHTGGTYSSGVYMYSPLASFTMSGGTITGNRYGVYVNTGASPLTMTGGTITGNERLGVRLPASVNIVINGSVTIDRIGISIGTAANTIIYLGDNFGTLTPIVIDFLSTNFSSDLGTARDILKGGTPAVTTGIDSSTLEKFSVGKMFSNSTFTTEVTNGIISLGLNGGTNFGYAQWTP